MNELKNNIPEIKTKAILAQEYGITYRTFSNWLRRNKFYEIHPEAKNTSILTPKQLAFIYEKLDLP